MDWGNLIMNVIVAALIGVAGIALGHFLSEMSIGKKVMEKLRELNLGKEHIARKEEHCHLEKGHTNILNEMKNTHNVVTETKTTIGGIREAQIQDIETKKAQLEALNKDQQAILRSFQTIEALKEQWLMTNQQNQVLQTQYNNLEIQHHNLQARFQNLETQYYILTQEQGYER